MEQTSEKNEDYGYVYVLKNECMPGLIKIGITDNMQERMRTLNNTSVPVQFEAVYTCKVSRDDMRKIETALHKAFSPDRVNPKREFFRMDADRVIPILSMFQIENVTDETNRELSDGLDPQERVALEKEKAEAPRRRETFNFSALGIREGEQLQWKDDHRIFATVASERKVVYNGALMSLTAATSKIKGLSYGIQPTPFWLYNGRPLIDIYMERYSPVDSEE